MELEVRPHRLFDGVQGVTQSRHRGGASGRGILHTVLKHGHERRHEVAEVELGWKDHRCGPGWC